MGRASLASRAPVQQRRRALRERGSAADLHALTAHVRPLVDRQISRALGVVGRRRPPRLAQESLLCGRHRVPDRPRRGRRGQTSGLPRVRRGRGTFWGLRRRVATHWVRITARPSRECPTDAFVT